MVRFTGNEKILAGTLYNAMASYPIGLNISSMNYPTRSHVVVHFDANNLTYFLSLHISVVFLQRSYLWHTFTTGCNAFGCGNSSCCRCNVRNLILDGGLADI